MASSISREESDIFYQLLNQLCSSEECFCMILSLHGYEKTKDRFPSIVQRAKQLSENLRKELLEISKKYFQENDSLETSVENGFYTNDFGEDLDMELALALSLADLKSNNSPSSKLTNSQSHFKESMSPFPNVGTPRYQDRSTISYADRLKQNSSKDVYQNNKADAGLMLIPNSEPPIPEKDIEKSQSEEPTQNKKRRNRKKNKTNNPSVCGMSGDRHQSPVIVWFRRDLRLYDNPALISAGEKAAPVIFVYLWSEKEEGPLAAGGAVKVWLHEALKCLNADIDSKYSNKIIFRKTNNSKSELMKLFAETGAKTLCINDLYEPHLKQRDDEISASLKAKGIKVERFHSYLLHEPGSLNLESVGMRGIGSVTHFMECCRRSAMKPIGQPVDAPPNLRPPTNLPRSGPLEALGLNRMPKRKDGSKIDWAAPIRKSWNFSEDGAWEALGLFLENGIKNYEKESGRSDMLNTCRISPYLHFGQISPRSVLSEARHRKSPKFLRKLAWRDLSYWLLSLFPDMPSRPMRQHYCDQRWSHDAKHLKAWQRGNTGYPLVDAAMRQLWLTGWCNNYMRHVVASFLISYLHLHWVEGYAWFQDTLLDADVAINSMMWQNGGMSGLDQWNFVMHPVDAAMTCDPKGQYVRQWCPELAGIPNEFIHKPWKCPPSVRRRAGVELGVNYPERIITDLEDAREQSLRDVVKLRRSHPEMVDRYTGNDLVLLPSGLLLPVITRKEFKYKTSNPEAKDNPHTAVLRGYRSRKRDEAVAFANKVDFLSSTMSECQQRYERYEKAASYSTF